MPVTTRAAGRAGRYRAVSSLLPLFLAACSEPQPEGPEAFFGGNWGGYLNGGPAWAYLSQGGDGRVAGNLDNPPAAIVGQVVKDRLTFTLTASTGTCIGTYTGSATVSHLADRDRMSFAASGATSCGGPAGLTGFLDLLRCSGGLSQCGLSWERMEPLFCADLTTDPAHCGWCGGACGDLQACNGGRCLVPACAGPVGFEAPISFLDGEYLTAALVDLDGDGSLDVVVANRREVDVLLGDGRGGFRPVAATPLVGAVAVAIGDLDGDGLGDVVAYAVVPDGAYGYTGSVQVLLGNDDGSFRPGPVYPAGIDGGWWEPGVRPVALADLDGDGILDVVARAGRVAVVQVRLGQGDGTFGPARDVALQGEPRALVATDLNGDGMVDLALLTLGWDGFSYQSAVEILLGNGDGTFAAPTAFEPGSLVMQSDLAVGDFDGNGVPDLSVAAYYGLWMLLGNGDGSFAAPVEIAPIQINGIAVADVDGDGHDDVVGAESGFYLVLGRGDGTFEEPFRYPGERTWSIAAGRLGGGGAMDLVVGSILASSTALGASVYLSCPP